MSLSFWIFLFVSVISFIPCWMDHGETRGELRSEQFRTTGKQGVLRLKLALLWGIPGLFLAATVISGFEAVNSDKQMQGRENTINGLSNQLTHLTSEYDQTTNALNEANARLKYVSDVAEMNSPLNFPIKTIDGRGSIVISEKDSPSFLSALGCPISLFLVNNEIGNTSLFSVPGKTTAFVTFEGRVDSVQTNRGNAILGITVHGERNKTAGVWGSVTVNNVGSVKAEFFCTNPEQPFVINGGFLELTLDSLHNVSFLFSTQTNETGGEWGVVGRREERWTP